MRTRKQESWDSVLQDGISTHAHIVNKGFWPIVAAAGAGLIGSIINRDAQRQSDYENRKLVEEMNAKNAAREDLYARDGIKMKMADAAAAGVHPLYALGAQTYQPQAQSAFTSQPDFSTGNMVSDMGQNISRAVAATSTAEEKQMTALRLTNAQLQNELLASQIHQMNRTGPAFPGVTDNFIPGQGDSGLVKENPAQRTMSAPGRPAQEAGWVPDVGYARTDTGLAPVPSSDVKNRIEDQIIPEGMWAIRNQLMPNVTKDGAPPKSMLPEGAKRWEWDYSKQEWQPRYDFRKEKIIMSHEYYKNQWKNPPFWAR